MFVGHEGPRHRDMQDKNKLYARRLFSVVSDREWPGCPPGDWGRDIPGSEKLYARNLGLIFWAGLLFADLLHSLTIMGDPETQRKRDDNKNKICVFGGGGLAGGQRGKLSKTLFFMGNATTIKFWKWNFYCRGILLSRRRLLETLILFFRIALYILCHRFGESDGTFNLTFGWLSRRSRRKFHFCIRDNLDKWR